MSGSQSPDRSMVAAGVPLMGEVFPEVSAALASVLVELEEPQLAARLPHQGFYGRCACKPGCRFVLTAPAGSSGSRMLWLEVAGDVIGEVSLDTDGMFVTNFEIDDCAALGIQPDWYDAAVWIAPEACR